MVTERLLRMLIHLSSNFQAFEIMEQTLSGKNEPKELRLPEMFRRKTKTLVVHIIARESPKGVNLIVL